jgi:HK97 family phage major capsid protein
MSIEQLKARLAEIQDAATAIQAKADAEKRDLSEDEDKQLEGYMAEFDKTAADIQRRERLEAQSAKLTASAGRKAAPNKVENTNGRGKDDDFVEGKDIRVNRQTAAQGARWGWQGFGDFAYAVKNVALGRSVDDRLTNASLTTYGSEGVGPDGGFAVPPEFRATILQKVMGDESILSRCDQVQTSGYSITVPKDETTPWGTAGIQGYWDGEAATMTQKKPALETSTVKVHKLTSLVPVTDELLEDAPALGSYVQSRAATVLDFKVTDAIINGTGAGMPLGILASPCKVQQGKESSQVADTVHGLNLVKMWARMPANWRSSAVWLIHPDVEPHLMSAGLQVGPAAAGSATGGTLIYMPPGGVSQSPYASLFGRPVIPVQACQAIGDAGDIIFANLQQYAAVLKAGGLKTDSSIHLWFDQGTTAFRFVLRMGGQPWWSAAISAKNGSTTYGPFVTLEAR